MSLSVVKHDWSNSSVNNIDKTLFSVNYSNLHLALGSVFQLYPGEFTVDVVGRVPSKQRRKHRYLSNYVINQQKFERSRQEFE